MELWKKWFFKYCIPVYKWSHEEKCFSISQSISGDLKNIFFIIVSQAINGAIKKMFSNIFFIKGVMKKICVSYVIQVYKWSNDENVLKKCPSL